MTAINFVWQPYFAIILHRPSLLTVSKALVRSTKVEFRFLFLTLVLKLPGSKHHVVSPAILPDATLAL